MKCPACQEALFTLRSVSATNGRASDLRCPHCGLRATSITLIEETPEERVERTRMVGRTQKLKARTGFTARSLVKNGILVLPS